MNLSATTRRPQQETERRNQFRNLVLCKVCNYMTGAAFIQSRIELLINDLREMTR